MRTEATMIALVSIVTIAALIQVYPQSPSVSRSFDAVSIKRTPASQPGQKIDVAANGVGTLLLLMCATTTSRSARA